MLNFLSTTQTAISVQTLLPPEWHAIADSWSPNETTSERLTPVPQRDSILLNATGNAPQQLLVPELPFNRPVEEYKTMQDKIAAIRSTLGIVKESNSSPNTGILHAHLTPISVPVSFKQNTMQLNTHAIANPSQSIEEIQKHDEMILNGYVEQFAEYKSVKHIDRHGHYVETVLGGTLDPIFNNGLFGLQNNSLTPFIKLVVSMAKSKDLSIIDTYVHNIALQYYCTIRGRWLQYEGSPATKIPFSESNIPYSFLLFQNDIEYRISDTHEKKENAIQRRENVKKPSAEKLQKRKLEKRERRVKKKQKLNDSTIPVFNEDIPDEIFPDIFSSTNVTEVAQETTFMDFVRYVMKYVRDTMNQNEAVFVQNDSNKKSVFASLLNPQAAKTWCVGKAKNFIQTMSTARFMEYPINRLKEVIENTCINRLCMNSKTAASIFDDKEYGITKYFPACQAVNMKTLNIKRQDIISLFIPRIFVHAFFNPNQPITVLVEPNINQIEFKRRKYESALAKKQCELEDYMIHQLMTFLPNTTLKSIKPALGKLCNKRDPILSYTGPKPTLNIVRQRYMFYINDTLPYVFIPEIVGPKDSNYTGIKESELTPTALSIQAFRYIIERYGSTLIVDPFDEDCLIQCFGCVQYNPDEKHKSEYIHLANEYYYHMKFHTTVGKAKRFTAHQIELLRAMYGLQKNKLSVENLYTVYTGLAVLLDSESDLYSSLYYLFNNNMFVIRAAETFNKPVDEFILHTLQQQYTEQRQQQIQEWNEFSRMNPLVKGQFDELMKQWKMDIPPVMTNTILTSMLDVDVIIKAFQEYCKSAGNVEFDQDSLSICKRMIRNVVSFDEYADFGKVTEVRYMKDGKQGTISIKQLFTSIAEVIYTNYIVKIQKFYTLLFPRAMIQLQNDNSDVHWSQIIKPAAVSSVIGKLRTTMVKTLTKSKFKTDIEDILHRFQTTPNAMLLDNQQLEFYNGIFHVLKYGIPGEEQEELQDTTKKLELIIAHCERESKFIVDKKTMNLKPVYIQAHNMARNLLVTNLDIFGVIDDALIKTVILEMSRILQKEETAELNEPLTHALFDVMRTKQAYLNAFKSYFGSSTGSIQQNRIKSFVGKITPMYQKAEIELKQKPKLIC